jgi:hypothetical protein
MCLRRDRRVHAGVSLSYVHYLDALNSEAVARAQI